MAPKKHFARLCPCGFGLAMGICWGLGMLITGWVAMFGWATSFVDVMASIYLGFDASFAGAIIGGIWGFGCAFIAGYVTALLYNCFKK